MRVVVKVGGREAIPVRAVPLLTDWRFMSPDELVRVLARDEGALIRHGQKGLQAYRVVDGVVRPILSTWWAAWALRALDALSEEIVASEVDENSGQHQWRSRSLLKLPAEAFVWRDQFEQFHDRNFRVRARGLRSTKRAPDASSNNARKVRNPGPGERTLLEEVNSWRELDFSPMVPPYLSSLVCEGFDQEPITSSNPASALHEDRAVVRAPVQFLGKPLPPPLKTSEMASGFAPLGNWDEKAWKKALGNKPKWLQACVVIPGARGVRETCWNPVSVGAALVRLGRAPARSVRAKFQSDQGLKPWLEQWKDHESEYIDAD